MMQIGMNIICGSFLCTNTTKNNVILIHATTVM